MEINEYINTKQVLHQNLLNFIDHDQDTEENFASLINIINDQKLSDNPHELNIFLCLLANISYNYYRSSNFFNKLERIILHLKNSILKFFTNSKIFKIFKFSKRIILFLIEQEIIKIDESIVILLKKLKKDNYLSYFFPEIKNFLTEEEFKENNIEHIENFYEKRKIGENDDPLCEIIRNDSIEEFITYINQKNLNLSMSIKPSIFETNPILFCKDKFTLIEYSSFFGSMQIFKYLHLNGIELEPELVKLSFHGSNPELIYYLEENMKESDELMINEGLKQSIQCHQNCIVDYIQNNFSKKSIEEENELLSLVIKTFNFLLFPKNIINEFIFYYLCSYNYVNLVKLLLKTGKININKKVISNKMLK